MFIYLSIYVYISIYICLYINISIVYLNIYQKACTQIHINPYAQSDL